MCLIHENDYDLYIDVKHINITIQAYGSENVRINGLEVYIIRLILIMHNFSVA